MKRIILAVIVLFVLNVVLNACSEKRGGLDADGGFDKLSISNKCPAQTNGSEFAGIVNGKTLGAGNMFSSRVVGVVAKIKEGMETCTGSLLPGNVVLIAAHCVVGDQMGVIFSTDWKCTGDQTEGRKVEKIVVHPSADEGRSMPNDLAMVKFTGSVPAGYVPFSLPGADMQITDDDNMIMIGFGRTARKVQTDFKLRITSNKGEKLMDRQNGVFTIDQRSSGVCSGDSGSPLIVLRNGVPQIAGVASAVWNPGTSQSEACNGVSFFVSTAAQAEWIRQTHAELTR